MYFKPSLNGLDPEEGQRVASNEVGDLSFHASTRACMCVGAHKCRRSCSW
jgi:hypothetical protein